MGEPGRPRIEFSDEDIENIERLAAVLNQAQIADFLGCSERTLRNRMEEDPKIYAAYKRGRAAAINDVAKGLLQRAKEGDNTAAIFYLKTQARWSEKQELEVSGKDGAPGLTVVLNTQDADGE